ncbi:hypothetical protein BC937DRAFT_95178 [Endogone sp. FLAS-F59071]|nr:hypothetical protein BC937DRAFT_95178 [Endogone sp. FLAS-F59071]|eukprot:RUS13525.1 hypothetical protein BC937DRAFT_95178 [Endogone sp. FLAS-F59071]
MVRSYPNLLQLSGGNSALFAIVVWRMNVVGASQLDRLQELIRSRPNSSRFIQYAASTAKPLDAACPKVNIIFSRLVIFSLLARLLMQCGDLQLWRQGIKYRHKRFRPY